MLTDESSKVVLRSVKMKNYSNKYGYNVESKGIIIPGIKRLEAADILAGYGGHLSCF